MTTPELDRINESSLDILPPARRQADTSIAMLTSHAEMMSTAHKLASAMVNTSLVPQRFQGRDKAEDATAAILYGLELGLNPIQSLQRVIPIHGMPSLEARTMVALLQARGYKVKTRAQSDTSVTVFGRDLDGDEYETTWTIDRAIQAGYVPKPSSDKSLQRPDVQDDWVTVTKTWNGKSKTSIVGNMKYITDPQAMLKAKAQSEVCREIAPEILLGIGYTREDLESENWSDEYAPRRVQADRGSITVDELDDDDVPAQQNLGDKIKPAAEPEPEPQPEPETGEEDPETTTAGVDWTDAEIKPDPEPTPEPAEKPVTAPGGLSVNTPGQTERVAAALNKAGKGGAAKALTDMIGTLLAKSDITDPADVLAIAAHILKTEISTDLDLKQLKQVHDTLIAWRDVGTLNKMITDALNWAEFRKNGDNDE